MFDKFVNYVFKKKLQNTVVIICMMLLSILFFVIGIVISFALKDCDQVFRENVITIYAATVGGFLALFGVFLTIIAGKGTEQERRRLGYIPEFFLPKKYDLAKAIYYSLVCNDRDGIIIPNYRIYIQNTDKTEFIINEIKVVSNNEALISDSLSRYIDKGSLFCLSFYNEANVDTLIIKAKSIDKEDYTFEIDLNGKTINRK